MMLIALALAAQTVSLPADKREAAMKCGAAVRAATADATTDDVMKVTYLALTAVDSGSNETVLDRSQATMSEMMTQSAAIGADAPALLVLCEQRFPLAFATEGAVLPSDDYTRRAICSTSAAALSGMMPSDPSGAQLLRNRFGSLLTAADYSARRITTAEKARTELGRLFRLSLTIGNFGAIVHACEAAYPA